MLIFGKRKCRSTIEALLIGKTNNLLYIYDQNSKNSFLLDSGADCSIFPANYIQINFKNLTNDLYAANESRIASYGTEIKKLKFGNFEVDWKFYLTKTKKPIIGSDFLYHFKAVIDYSQKILKLNNGVCLKLNHVPNFSISNSINTLVENKYSKLFQTNLKNDKLKKINTNVKFYITTTGGPPIYCRPRRLNCEKLEAAKHEFAKLEKNKIIRRSSSQWASPLHMVQKKNGDWRLCGDYRRINLVTTPDRYPIPNIQDFVQNLANCKVFSKIDMIRGYLQISVAEEDIPKTAITTPFGLFEFTRMPFGLRNAAQTFQRIMDSVFKNINFVFVYIDDILIASPDIETHYIHVKTVANLLNQAGLQVNIEKCEFEKKEIEFLGHYITSKGIKPSQNKVKAIQEIKKPKTVKELLRFLGMVNFYHRFLPNISAALKPLYKSVAKEEKVLIWNQEMLDAFNYTKSEIAKKSLLHFPIKNASLSLTTDASKIAIGATLSQLNNNNWEPIAYYSHLLNQTQQRYSTFDRELQAIFSAIRHFRYFLEGRSITVFTDHKPLTFALHKKSDYWSARQQRQLSFISEFTSNINHVPGKNNIIADTLSRPTINTITNTIQNYLEFAISQKKDKKIQSYTKDPKSFQIKSIPFGNQPINILCDTSYGKIRPIVPNDWKQIIFEKCHNFSHPSIRSTKKLISDRFAWENMKKDITYWTKTCKECQKSKVQTHIKTNVQKIIQPTKRFSHIHVDIVGPLPTSNEHKYLFTIIDRFSRWPEAIPMIEATAENCTENLINHWISRFGIPDKITCDNGRQFTSNIWKNTCFKFNIELIYCSKYHPQSNGMIERFHRTLKQTLIAMSKGNEFIWYKNLPMALLGLRITPKEDIKLSASQIVYGENIKSPLEFNQNQKSNFNANQLIGMIHNFKNINTTPIYHGEPKSRINKNLKNATHVWVQNPTKKSLQYPYSGPYKIIKLNDKVVQIEKNGIPENISIDRTKVALVEDFKIFNNQGGSCGNH